MTKADARTFGQDLMRGEGTNVLPGRRPSGRLTFATGNERRDEASAKILASGRNTARAYNDHDWQAKTLGNVQAPTEGAGTSIFDPVLCELVYRWFAPPGGAVLDPFAGGSVRGIVAAVLGMAYTGIDLRAEQIQANDTQAAAILRPDQARPRWIVGDALDAKTLAPGEYDLIFSCPPYADLERYSDNPADLSTMDYAAFLDAYRRIIAGAVGMLRPNRFAVFVVGDVRDKRGFYRNFVGDTVAAFHDAGADLYNEAILVTAVGSLALRVDGQFRGNRKLGKTHQNVLVFYKGDPRRIKTELGEVETINLAQLTGDGGGLQGPDQIGDGGAGETPAGE